MYTKISPTGKPQCLLCNKEFLYQKSLDFHVKVHYEEKKFDCKECNERFRTKT